VAGGQVEDALAIDGRIEGEVEGLQRLGAVERRPTDTQRELLVFAARHLVFQQTREKVDIRPLTINRLSSTQVERLENARQSQPLERGFELMLQVHDTPPSALPTRSRTPRTKARAVERSGAGGSAGVTRSSPWL